MRFLAMLLAMLMLTPPAMAQTASPPTEALLAKCNSGDGEACYDYGMLFEAGSQVPKDWQKSARYYAMACDTGSAHGCAELSVLYANGTGVPKNWEMAHQYDVRACDGGLAFPCEGAGYDYAVGGRGVPQDKQAAQTFYQRAADLYARNCEKGDAYDCQHLSILLQRSNPPLAYRAVQLWQAACDAGKAKDCSSAAGAYEHGQGVKRDQDIAAGLYRRSCQLGDAGGCNGFGQLGLDGHTAGAAPAEIISALDARCQSGDSYRCSLLGDALVDGKLGARAPQQAMTYFSKGCDPAYRDYRTFGCIRLALGYLHGEGAPQDQPRAITILTKLCEQQGSACFTLGKIYFRGDSVALDMGKARDRFEDGCDAGNNLSCYALAAMIYEGKGGSIDIAKAASLRDKAC